MPTKASLLLIFLSAELLAQTPGERMVAEYFRRQAARVAERALADIQSVEDWQEKRKIYREQLLEMLGLFPLPQRTELKATVTGKIESENFTVEKIHFQSLPSLYVSANLYLPKKQNGPAPAILYLCGHARVFKDGTAYGNKANYQHHPAWFADQGYVALILDTLDLGEIEGEHHGTSRRGFWWWPTRGYTPAGVETWNAIRALDYLETRPEVDKTRLGVTGRSGGGAYTWFLAAVDERPSVLAPVAGITDMTNHIVDGAIEGHCDCMYQCNTYAWDFALVAALSAPRPLLLCNSDKDRIFPLDGVLRIHRQLKRIYSLYGADDKLGIFISEGPHSDTQELQLASFRWMNRWLKNETGPVAQVAGKSFSPEDLKVFNEIPPDQLNTKIDESFVPSARVPPAPTSLEEWEQLAKSWRGVLREKVFNNWPETAPSAQSVRVASDQVRNGIRIRMLEYIPKEPYRLESVLLTPDYRKLSGLSVRVLDNAELIPWNQDLDDPEGNFSGSQARKDLDAGIAVALVMPRGVGRSAWDSKMDLQIRRRFLLLGQSLEAMQVWDTLAALRALQTLEELRDAPVRMQGTRNMSIVALFAGIFDESVSRLELEDMPETIAQGPSLPNLARYVDLPQVVALAFPRMVVIRGRSPEAWQWTQKIATLTRSTLTFR